MNRAAPINPSSELIATPSFTMHCRAAAREVWQGLNSAVFNRYRPELHYMRGPGPKSREKARAQLLDSRG
jgi:hypothetical protein